MKTVIEMAREVGFTDGELSFMTTMLEAFAALVRADEREACAKVCESIESDGYLTIEHQQCAAAIRARGETK
jgi:hypothetical protein